ncbi:hypothetical protein LTR17_010675 [Elasticomyces elasticus]|nr:hypothetical protein LTR17_010675 [Elasticomyces elasticus]
MAPQQTLEEKLEACINALLQKEFPYTHTSDINEVASSTARTAARQIVAKKAARKDGVRALKLLDLPNELLDRIYEYAVTYHCSFDKDDTTIAFRSFCSNFSDEHPAKQPAITKVSRQVREATLGMFYKLNQFYIRLTTLDEVKVMDGTFQACQWLESIGAQNVESIKNITIQYCPFCPGRTLIMDMMKNSKLKSVVKVAKVEVRSPWGDVFESVDCS